MESISREELDNIESIAKKTIAFVEVLKELGFYKSEILDLALEYFKKLSNNKEIKINYDNFRKFVEDYREFDESIKNKIKKDLCEFLTSNGVNIKEISINRKKILKLDVNFKDRRKVIEIVQKFIEKH